MLRISLLVCMLGLPIAYSISQTQIGSSASAVDRRRCGALTKEFADQYAKDNTLIIMAIDGLLFNRFAKSWIQNIALTGATNWLIAALDADSNAGLASLGVTQCFDGQQGQEKTESEGQYQWGSRHWHQTTWRKVHVVRAVYALGYHVLHSDADATWFSNPMPWVRKVLHSDLPHVMFSSDSLETANKEGDEGFEANTSPHYNINTGIYFIRQYPEGLEFLDVWLGLQAKNIGHDQDGVNTLVRDVLDKNSRETLSYPCFCGSTEHLARGVYRSGDQTLPKPVEDSNLQRMFWCALHNKTAVTLMPVHLWGNAYTYRLGRVHEVLHSQLQVIHWVWTGGSPECKIQNIRDAMRYVDPPEYYGMPAAANTSPITTISTVAATDVGTQQGQSDIQTGGQPPLMLLTMAIDVPLMPGNYNQITLPDTEQMVMFHLSAAEYQLQQAYWGIMAAAVLNRTWVWPPFQCFCAKNWYMTQACRINGERHTVFPFNCSLPDLMRARKVMAGMVINLPGMNRELVVPIRETPFLQHPKVPAEIKKSRLVIEPTGDTPRLASQPLVTQNVQPAIQPDGTAVLKVPWPLNTVQLQQVIAAAGGPWRVVHLANATRILGGGFPDPADWAAFDHSLSKYATTWCCRSPNDQEQLGKPVKEQLHIVPAWRRQAKLAMAGQQR